MKGSRKHPPAPNLIQRGVQRGVEGVIVLLGPQGSGKGTQAKLLAKKRHLTHLEVGGLLRAEAKKATPLGRRIQKVVNEQGKLFPFRPTMALARAAVRRIPGRRGILFDGTPRRMEEVRFWERELPKLGRALTHFLFLNVSRQESIRRLARRRICSVCGSLWIKGVDVPSTHTPCPRCGGKLFFREDDRRDAVRKRLSWTQRKTRPVIHYYRRKGILHEINGEQPIAAVHRDILRALKKR